MRGFFFCVCISLLLWSNQPLLLWPLLCNWLRVFHFNASTARTCFYFKNKEKHLQNMSTHVLDLFFFSCLYMRSQIGKVYSCIRTCLRWKHWSWKVRFKCSCLKKSWSNQALRLPSYCFSKCWSSWLRVGTQWCMATCQQNKPSKLCTWTLIGDWLSHSEAVAFLKSLTLLLSKIGCMNT